MFLLKTCVESKLFWTISIFAQISLKVHHRLLAYPHIYQFIIMFSVPSNTDTATRNYFNLCYYPKLLWKVQYVQPYISSPKYRICLNLFLSGIRGILSVVALFPVSPSGSRIWIRVFRFGSGSNFYWRSDLDLAFLEGLLWIRIRFFGRIESGAV